MSRLVGLATAVGMLATLAIAAPAMAETDNFTCTFTGSAWTEPVPSVENTLSEPLRSGATSISGAGDCALADTDGTVAYGSVSLSASGRFVNFVCGTGAWAGRAFLFPQIAVVGAWGDHSFLVFDFTILFAGGNGAMVITNATDGSFSPPPLGAGAGYANIAPDALNAGGNCINQDVSGFLMQGGFTATVPS